MPTILLSDQSVPYTCGEYAISLSHILCSMLASRQNIENQSLKYAIMILGSLNFKGFVILYQLTFIRISHTNEPLVVSSNNFGMQYLIVIKNCLFLSRAQITNYLKNYFKLKLLAVEFYIDLGFFITVSRDWSAFDCWQSNAIKP